MTLTATPAPGRLQAEPTDRFRLHRAGILNVWQYDDQEFLLADGRMLLRGANGAGKSKTLEMLLPFALDGDKARITASARHHTSLLWLMTDGYDGQARIGYVWVEFLRQTDGGAEAFTCGVGIRASASARTATAWHFATRQRIGHDLLLEDDGGPLSRPRLEEAIGAAGQVFQQAAAYKEYVGRSLFGLDPGQYDEVLRLLYWLRQPQVGEDIEPARLAGQLAQSLPQLDEHAVKAAGDTFDELTAYGEQIERRQAAAEALAGLASAYATYARRVAATHGRGVVEAHGEERRLRSACRRLERGVADLTAGRDETLNQLDSARRGAAQDQGRIAELEAGPEARDQRRLGDLTSLAEERDRVAADAQSRVDRGHESLQRRERALALVTDDLTAHIRTHVQAVRDLDSRQRECSVGADLPVPPVLETDRLEEADRADALDAGLATTVEAVQRAGVAVSHRQAAVGVVRAALDRIDEARRQQAAAEHRAEETERRWEQARERREAARADQETLAQSLTEELAAWVGEATSWEVTAPTELTPESVTALPGLARAAAEPGLTRLRLTRQSAVTARDNAAAAIEGLTRTRIDIEAETDPAPPTSTLARTRRPDGYALWQLVDFDDAVSDAARAGLEAALQDSGLLDAWLRPDGRLLDPESRDVVLDPGVRADAGTLADVLHPDLPASADVSGADVERALRTIRVGYDVNEPDVTGSACVDVDGRWRLGNLRGRTGKERAQFIGATARAHERQRRLDEIDEALSGERAAHDTAAEAVVTADGAISTLERWVHAVPTGDALRASWTRLEERRDAEERDGRANAEAQDHAHQARTTLVAVRSEGEQLSSRHEVPFSREGLDALGERLGRLDHDLTRVADQVGPLRRDVARWAQDRRALARDEAALAEERADTERLGEGARETRARLEELRAAVGAGVRELEQRLVVLRAGRDAHEQAGRDAETRLRELERQLGTADQAVAQAVDALTAQSMVRLGSLRDVTALNAVPGLVEAAFGEEEPDLRSTLAGVADLPDDEPTPPGILSVADRLAALASVGDEPDPSAVWRAYNDATSGPGADHEPAVATYDSLLAVSGRDDAGERPIAQLAVRVGAAVARDRELLTERERQRFEQHVLGELGDAIRRCRVEADELVAAMNQLLAEVTTSQGIRVRLDWKLRDDIPPEAREAVRLLGQPVGALLPEERAHLRDALHRLIEVSRAEHPELAYGEHLAASLDYRGWFAFKIRYTRPESAGSWLELHRRSPLSQGEQKVLCYLPLFAAAAAHFTSLAGAAPYAPRLVLLDDAFPKIDVRTHPLLFGLLVQLDLDFVVTSERLWGDHDTVPSLAIYEALRDPNQRGIAQYEYRWDGRQLRSLG